MGTIGLCMYLSMCVCVCLLCSHRVARKEAKCKNEIQEQQKQVKSSQVESSRVESIYFSAFNKLVESINHQPLNVMLIRSAKDKKSMICQLYTLYAGVRSF